MKIIKNILLHVTVLTLLLLSTNVHAQRDSGNILIKNGTLLTITDGTKENTDILVQNGKISKIGKNLKAPKGAEVVDANGMFVMPGVIDAHSHIAASAINEVTGQITPEVHMEDVINPLDISIYRALAGGVTIANVMHGSANVIGGRNVTMKLRYGSTNPEQLIFEEAPKTIKFALGENPTRISRSRGIQPSSRMGVEAILRNAFSDAQIYKKKWQEYNSNKNNRKIAPEYDLRMETLVDILDGKILVHCHSYRADEIYMLMKVFSDFGIEKLTFQHANEGYKVAPEIAAFGASASVFADWWAYKLEVYYSTAYNAAILTKNGVTTSINSDSGELIRHLYHEAAKTQKYGELSDNEALALITNNPAKQLGIDNMVGSLEVGKHGDIAIFDKHPLSTYAIPQMTIIEGVKYFDRETDAKDQRIMVNPEAKIDLVQLYDRQDNSHHLDEAEWINLEEFLNQQ